MAYKNMAQQFRIEKQYETVVWKRLVQKHHETAVSYRDLGVVLQRHTRDIHEQYKTVVCKRWVQKQYVTTVSYREESVM